MPGSVTISEEFLRSLSDALKSEPSLRPFTAACAEQLVIFFLQIDHDRDVAEKKQKREEWR